MINDFINASALGLYIMKEVVHEAMLFEMSFANLYSSYYSFFTPTLLQTDLCNLMPGMCGTNRWTVIIKYN